MDALSQVNRINAPDALTIDVLQRHEFAAICSEWQPLSRRAIEPNIFYDPDFLLPASDVFAPDTALQLLTIRSSGALVFALPFTRSGFEPMRIGTAFDHPYATTTAPLVDERCTAQVLRCWLDMDLAPLGISGWHFSQFPADGRLHDLIEAALAECGNRTDILSRHERALLAPETPERTYIEARLSRKTRKEMGRLKRRLAELGPVEHRILTGDAAIEGLEAYQALEAAGWKGRGGSAMAQSAPIKKFVDRAISALNARDGVRIDQLFCGEKLIATTIMLKNGAHGWLWKVAYDEAFAKYSPAVMMIADMTSEIAGVLPGARIDSCAVPDHPMIDRLWAERRPIMDMAIAPHVGAGAGYRLSVAALRAEKMLRTQIRKFKKR